MFHSQLAQETQSQNMLTQNAPWIKVVSNASTTYGLPNENAVYKAG